MASFNIFGESYNNNVVNDLNILLATIDGLCIKSRGFTFNLMGLNFYEMHTFLNLTIEYMHTTGYNIGERIRSLGGIANFSVQQIIDNSLITDVYAPISNGLDIVNNLLPDYTKITQLAQNIFKNAGPQGDAGTIALVTGIALKMEHFAWEIRMMTKGCKC